MNVSELIQIDVQVQNALAGLFVDEKQVRYATMLTLNRMAETINFKSRERIKERMVVRSSFILPPLQLPRAWRATVDNLAAMVAYGVHGGNKRDIGQRRQDILSKFDFGGVKYMKGLNSPIAIPTKALRPTPQTSVPRSMFPQALRLVPRRGPSATLQPKMRKTVHGPQVVGKRGTFVLDPSQQPGLSPRDWGVYERFGPKKGDIRMLWAYRKSIPIPHSLDLVPTARAVMASDFVPTFQAFYALAVRTAR